MLFLQGIFWIVKKVLSLQMAPRKGYTFHTKRLLFQILLP